MTLSEFAGLNHSKTDFETYYNTIIDKLGGVHAIQPYIPFDIKTLKQAYAKDEHFNTPQTPIRKWDAATGIHTGCNQSNPPRATYGGLLKFLACHGVSYVSQADCVCILKQAARNIVNSCDRPAFYCC